MQRLAWIVVTCSFASTALGQFNPYRDAFRTEVGPQIIREHRWAEVWAMAATNDYFRRNPKATINDFNREFGGTLEYLRKGSQKLSSDLKTGVSIMREFVGTVPGTGVLMQLMTDAAFKDQYELLDRTWSLDLQRPGVFKVADILTDGERCANTSKACRNAYSELFHDAKIADSVGDIVDAFHVKRLLGLPNDPNDVTDDVLRVRIDIDKRRGAEKGKVTEQDKTALLNLEAQYVKNLAQAAKEYRDETDKLRNTISAQQLAQRHQQRIDDLRASAYLFSTVVGFIDPVAGQRIGRVGEGFTQIVDAVGRRDISQVVLAANVVQGALTVASILTDQGPSFEQATLAALREIQQQIAELRAEMQRNFAGLNWKIDQVYFDLSKSLENITSRTVAIAQGIEDLASRTRDLADRIEQARAENAESFRNLDEKLLSDHEACFAGNDISYAEFTNCRAFISAMLQGVGSAPYVLNDDPSRRTLTLDMLRRPVPELAGYLARYASEQNNLNLDVPRFPHLATWSRFATTYVAVLQSHASYATNQTKAVLQDLDRIKNDGVRADNTLRSLGGHERAIFDNLIGEYLRAAGVVELAVRRSILASVRTTRNNETPLYGQEYFADHLVNEQRVPADYNLFGPTDQTRASFTVPSAQLFACPGGGPTQTNDSMRPHTLDQTIAFNKPFFALYGAQFDVPATTPANVAQVVPSAARMFADLTGRQIGLCVSDINWIKAGAVESLGFVAVQPVHLRVTVDLFVGNPGPRNYDAASVFAHIPLDTSAIANPVWKFSISDAGGGHGDHLVHRMHNFIFGTDNKQMMVQPMLDRVSATTPLTLEQPVLESLKQQTAQLLDQRRYLVASALAQLFLSKDGRVPWATFGGVGTADLLRAYDDWKIAHLLIDRYAALLLSDSYAHDRDHLTTALMNTHPDAYANLLAIIARAYECAHPGAGATPCSIKPETALAPLDYLTGTPVLVAVKNTTTPHDQVFTFASAKGAAATLGDSITKRFAAAQPVPYESIPVFVIAQELVRVEYERRAHE